MNEPPLDEKVVGVHGALDDAKVPHAFGGALALAYYAEPRATIDIDINVFVTPDHADRALEPLRGLGADEGRVAAGRVARDGQVRIHWGTTPLDLFFSYDPFHDACAQSARTVPFGDVPIPILAPEHLLVCKVAFDRPKDWLDIEQMLVTTAGELDLAEVRRWVKRFVGEDDARTRKLDEAIARTIGA